MDFNILFNSRYPKRVSFQNGINIKMLVYSVFHAQSSASADLHTGSTPQSGLATFQMLHSHGGQRKSRPEPE